jgi:hypothetical protein
MIRLVGTLLITNTFSNISLHYNISNVQHPVQSGFYNRNLKPTLITQFVEEIIANILENY